MKSDRIKKHIVCSAALLISLSAVTGCSLAKLVEYSSIAGNEQKMSHIRTEMNIIKGDDDRISKNYFIVSAVDYLQDDKKNYYLIVAQTPSHENKPKVDDLMLQYDYPFIIHGRSVGELISSLEKCTNEWDSTDIKYSGAVYNFFISSPQNPKPFYYDNRLFEIVPYIKFNYSKTVSGATARLALGSRMEEIVHSIVDGKTVKTRIFFKDEEQSWIFNKSEEMRDFQNLLNKGMIDLQEKGMDGAVKKRIVKEEEAESEVKTEEQPVEVKKPVKQKKPRRKKK